MTIHLHLLVQSRRILRECTFSLLVIGYDISGMIYVMNIPIQCNV